MGTLRSGIGGLRGVAAAAQTAFRLAWRAEEPTGGSQSVRSRDEAGDRGAAQASASAANDFCALSRTE